MRIDEFSASLFKEMEKKLSEIEVLNERDVQVSTHYLSILFQFISRLKEFTSKYKFVSQFEEINFFKNIKPKFLSKLIYYQRLFAIQSRLPVGTSEDIKNYYLDEIRKIRAWFHSNVEFLIYYQSYARSLDEIYFIRKEPDSWLLLNFEEYETDLSFTTIYDHKVSKIIAYKLLSEYIKTVIEKIDAVAANNIIPNADNLPQINWTTSKVALVELLYALQSAGVCNNGKTDLKQLANQLQSLFHIDLGNYYRIFQEMRIRKNNRTLFLDQLKERLVQRMDDSDENPKFG